MDIFEQNQSRIKFRAKTDERRDFRPSWYLLLNNLSPEGFSGMLSGDVFSGSRMIGLSFKPSDAEPNGTANRGQPVGSETNRASAAAGPGR
jgi:hypothetical protein